MGVDYYSCTNCQRNFPDCGSYFSCDCGYNYCSTKCGKYEAKESVDQDGNEEEISTCYLCRNEDASNETLFYYLLTKYNLTRENVLLDYLKDNKNI